MRDAEKWQINRFLELMEIAPEGTLEYPDPPDVVIRRGGSCVAIEHTLILRPTSPGLNLRAHEKRTDAIAAKAQQRFEANRSDVLQVTLNFDDSIQIVKSDEEEIAEVVAAVVAHHTPPVGGDWRLESWQFQVAGQPFPRAVDTIWVHNVPKWGALWGVARSSMVPSLTVDTVQKHIDGKEAKMASYRAACAEVWLLLVMEGFAPSSHWGLEDFPVHHEFDFTFERVFIYHQFAAEIRELKCRSASRSA